MRDSRLTAEPSVRPPHNVCEPTLNDMGYQIATLDPFSEAFVDFAGRVPAPVLDVGAAFGAATLAALQRGARVVANDLDPRHLEILSRRATPAQRRKLTLMPGRFPDEVLLHQQSLGAALLSRVMHFFSGREVEIALEMLFQAIHSRGKLFLVVEQSIFLELPPLLRAYERQQARGDRWPGFVTGVKTLIPRRAARIPDQLHYLSEDVLRRECERVGFVIERLESFTRIVEPEDAENGTRESLGVIARKP